MAHELLQMLQDVVVTWRAAASSRVVSIARSKLLLQRDERPPLAQHALSTDIKPLCGRGQCKRSRRRLDARAIAQLIDRTAP